MSESVSDALKLMRYGFYSITSSNNGEKNIMVANWVMQTSFEPRMIAIGLQKTSYTHRLLVDGGAFAVNIFKESDADIVTPFTKGRAKNPDKVKQADFTESPVTGCPVLTGATAYVECRVVQMVDIGGDHDILVGEVVGGEVLLEAETEEILSLADLGWSYAG